MYLLSTYVHTSYICTYFVHFYILRMYVLCTSCTCFVHMYVLPTNVNSSYICTYFVISTYVRLYVVRTYEQCTYVLRTYHSWASASRPMPPASVFRHPTFQSGTGAFRYPDWVRYRTGSGIGILFHSGTGLTGCRTVWHSGI